MEGKQVSELVLVDAQDGFEDNVLTVARRDDKYLAAKVTYKKGAQFDGEGDFWMKAEDGRRLVKFLGGATQAEVAILQSTIDMQRNTIAVRDQDVEYFSQKMDEARAERDKAQAEVARLQRIVDKHSACARAEVKRQVTEALEHLEVAATVLAD